MVSDIRRSGFRGILCLLVCLLSFPSSGRARDSGDLPIMPLPAHAVRGEGEFVIVPHGVEHKPVADEEVHLMLIEPKTTLNTGNVKNERTVAELERI